MSDWEVNRRMIVDIYFCVAYVIIGHILESRLCAFFGTFLDYNLSVYQVAPCYFLYLGELTSDSIDAIVDVATTYMQSRIKLSN